MDWGEPAVVLTVVEVRGHVGDGLINTFQLPLTAVRARGRTHKQQRAWLVFPAGSGKRVFQVPARNGDQGPG